MHHKKKRKLFVLYSIPIINNLCNKFNRKKYLVSYSIPLSCMVVLLLVGTILINPTNILNASAVEIGEIDNNNKTSDKDDIDDIGDNSYDVGTNEDTDNLDDNSEPDEAIINTEEHAARLAGSINIGISGQDQNTPTDAKLGEVAYRSQNVTISVSDVQSYSLVISGNSTLTPPSGGAVVNATADGVAGSNLIDLTWGYAWGNTTDLDANMRYYGLSPTGKNLAVVSLSNNQANFTKKLTFAAKFPMTAMTGNYINTSVKLSLIATPIQVINVWKDANGNPVTGLTTTATTMQGIKSGFCKNNDAVKTGYTIVLDDVRDNNEYVIVKLDDGNCWMQENLRLKLASNIALTPNDTDVAANWTPAKSTATGSGTSVSWTSNVYATDQVDSATFEDATNGNYYSWCAATAGTCSEAISGGTVASSSICPKGWGLPADYGGLISSGNLSKGTQLNAAPYNFPYAGSVQTGTLSSNGSVGKYWSGTSYDGNWAHRLEFSSDKISSYIDRRGYGLSVRCVADY